MAPTVTTPTPAPRRFGPPYTSTQQPLTVVRPAPLAPPPVTHPPRRQQTTPAAPAAAVTPPRPPRRRRSRATRIFGSILAGLLTLGGGFVTLLLTGQHELIAWLVVGFVMLVVFGTPLLCLVGLVACYIWALTRTARQRSRAWQPRPVAHPQGQRIIVGEVVFDD